MEFGEIFELFIDYQSNLKVVFVGSSDENGQPNCAPKLLIEVVPPNRVFYIDFAFSRTYANIDQNWQSSLSFMNDKKFIGYRFNGFSQVIDSGREFLIEKDKWTRKVNAYQAERMIERVKGVHSDLPNELMIPKNFAIVKFIAEEAAIVRPDRILRAIRNESVDSSGFPSAHPIKKIVELQTRLDEQLLAEKKAKEREKELEKTILEDELTGLYNRRGFIALVAQQLKVSRRAGKESFVIYSDIDGLKSINDNFGHHIGDKALVDIARILRKTFRDSDIVARIGGDEFAIAMTDCQFNEMDAVVRRLKDNLKVFNRVECPPHTLDLSIGIAVCSPGDPADIDELMKHADRKMYEEKQIKKAAH